MAELTRDDVRQAVRDELSNTLNDIHMIREMSARVDQRTNDLDASQQQISMIMAQLQNIEHVTQQLSPRDIQDIKLRVQNIEKGIAQIVQYLQSQSQATQPRDDGYRSV